MNEPDDSELAMYEVWGGHRGVFLQWLNKPQTEGACVQTLQDLDKVGFWINFHNAEYSVINRSIPWLLMPWRCKSPGHQQPCCWISYTGKGAIIFHKEGLEQSVPCLCWKIISYANIFFIKKISMTRIRYWTYTCRSFMLTSPIGCPLGVSDITVAQNIQFLFVWNFLNV